VSEEKNMRSGAFEKGIEEEKKAEERLSEAEEQHIPDRGCMHHNHPNTSDWVYSNDWQHNSQLLRDHTLHTRADTTQPGMKR
jgi:hypothetical protein